MYFQQINDRKLAQYAYLIGCQQTGEAIVIDPMRDIDRYIKEAESQNLTITAAADTHIHADYLSGLREFAERGVKVYASDEGGKDWKYEWLMDSDYKSQLLTDGANFNLGNIKFDVIHTPGHTPESISFLVTDGAATNQPMGILSGDFVFVGDVGRPDLLETAAGQKGAMEPAARELYQSVERFKKFPEYLQVWPAHGAGSACGKALGAIPESTVGYELRFSPAFKASGNEQEFLNYILDGQPEPPLYFSRMKRDNRSGPKVLGALPAPKRYPVAEIAEKGAAKDAVIIDTREKLNFMKGHLPGSLLAPYDRTFNTVAGSYVEDDKAIYLIIEQADLKEAVRDLICIGLDNIQGYTTPGALADYEGELATIPALSFEKAFNNHKDEDDYTVLDVRRLSEFREGHIEGAVNIAHTRLLARESELPKNKTLLVHCRTGVRASVASALLARDGYKVEYINDSIEDWLNSQQVHQ